MKYQEIPLHVSGSGENARLIVYLLDTPEDSVKIENRPVIILCPGGAYERTSFREGEPQAMYFLNQGYHVGILRYTTQPARFPTALLELGTAMKIFRENAKGWCVDEKNIFVQGSSAGGHLAASLGVFWKDDFLSEALAMDADILKPKGIVLSYPVISAEDAIMEERSFRALLGDDYKEKKQEVSLEYRVNKNTPPCFIWHTYEDTTVPVENSLVFAMALRKHNIPLELHIFQKGMHGLGPATALVERPDGTGVQKECQCWMELADIWMKNLM